MQTLLWCKDLKFCPDNSRNDWHGNVHDNVNVFGLGRIDLLHCCCGRASTETCYCDTSTTCCCEYVRNTAAAHITYINNPHSIHDYPIADLFRDGGGFLKHASTTIANIAKYLNAEQRAHWPPIKERTNQLCHVIMMPLCHVELDLSDCAIQSSMPELCIYFCWPYIAYVCTCRNFPFRCNTCAKRVFKQIMQHEVCSSQITRICTIFLTSPKKACVNPFCSVLLY